METPLIIARALHDGAITSLMGGLAFGALVARPALRRAGEDDGAERLQLQLARLAWASWALGVLSGLAWLLLEAESMSGKPLADVFGGGILATVLTRTHFGRDWALRGIIAVALALCLASSRRRAALRGAALALSAALLATIAGAGHAAAGRGALGALQLVSDGLHLLAAGAWLGGLLPLALFLAAARRTPSACALAAHDATQRFSRIGLAAVATLLATGVINGVLLVGSIPALLGTDYGRWLLVKVALFLLMVLVAAINRQWLTPRLALPRTAGPALAALRRNALIEAGLGALVLGVVGALGRMPPGLHQQPRWPLSFRLSGEVLAALPKARLEAGAALALATLGLVVITYALRRWRDRLGVLILGLALFLAGAAWPLHLMSVPAYPTTFYRPAVPLTAASVMRGEALYAEHCTDCHGVAGRGDGPLAKSTPVAPADLTAEHIFGHSDGDLFWWITEGIPGSGMPGLDGAVDERQVWDLVNFIHARAAGVQASDMSAQVTGFPAPLAPDFAWDTAQGVSETLRNAAAQGPVLLVFFSEPGSAARLRTLGGWAADLAHDGLRIVAIAAADPGRSERPPDGSADALVAATEAAVPAAYALFEGRGPNAAPARHTEFLIDREGYLRARWHPGDRPDWDDLAELRRQLARLSTLPLAPPAYASHVH